MENNIIREELVLRINKYKSRIENGFVLNQEERNEYLHLRRKLYGIRHKEMLDDKRITFSKLRKYIDGN